MRASILPVSLWILCLSLAVLLIYTRYYVRYYHAQTQEQKKEQFQLNVIWSQLVLEKTTLASDLRVEKIARIQLGMAKPEKHQMKVLK